MICACGSECREHEVLGRDTGGAPGRVVTCNARGRREFFPWSAEYLKDRAAEAAMFPAAPPEPGELEFPFSVTSSPVPKEHP